MVTQSKIQLHNHLPTNATTVGVNLMATPLVVDATELRISSFNFYRVTHNNCSPMLSNEGGRDTLNHEWTEVRNGLQAKHMKDAPTERNVCIKCSAEIVWVTKYAH